jgi:hypothetical protein
MWLGFGFTLAAIGDLISLTASTNSPSPVTVMQMVMAVILLLCASYFIGKMIKTPRGRALS